VLRRIRSKEKCNDFRQLVKIFVATALHVLRFSIMISWRAVLEGIQTCWIQNLAGRGCKVHNTTKMCLKNGALSQIIFVRQTHCHCKIGSVLLELNLSQKLDSEFMYRWNAL